VSAAARFRSDRSASSADGASASTGDTSSTSYLRELRRLFDAFFAGRLGLHNRELHAVQRTSAAGPTWPRRAPRRAGVSRGEHEGRRLPHHVARGPTPSRARLQRHVGMGKLRILHAIGVPTGVDDMARGSRARSLSRPELPNPFNPTTWIPFYLPSGVSRASGYTTSAASS